jgi:hypothetical protein
MKYLLVLLAIAGSARAEEYKLLEPREISFEASKIQGVHDPYLTPVDRRLTHSGLFRTDFNLIRYQNYELFMDNDLHFDQADSGKVVHGGWKFEIGATLYRHQTTAIEIYKQHHSRHIFEDTRPEHFPVRDAFGIRLQIYKRELK